MIKFLSICLLAASVSISAEEPSWAKGNVAVGVVAPGGKLNVDVRDESTSTGNGSTSQTGAGGAVAQSGNTKSLFNLNGAYAEIKGSVTAKVVSKTKSKSGGTTQTCAAVACAQSNN